MQNNTPSLFIYDDGNLRMAIDLATVTCLAKRPVGGGYWLNTSGQSIPVPTEVGEALEPALIAFKGKFTPGQSN